MPLRSDAAHTTTTAPAENAPAIAALEASTRDRDTGRARRYRRLPQAASPATASPANIDTARGSRKSSMALSAISGTVKPDVSVITDPQSPTRSATAGRL